MGYSTGARTGYRSSSEESSFGESDLYRSPEGRILSIHLPPSPKQEKPLPAIPRHPFASTSGIRRSPSLHYVPPTPRAQTINSRGPVPAPIHIPFPTDPAASMPQLEFGQRRTRDKIISKPPGTNASRVGGRLLKKHRSDTSLDTQGTEHSDAPDGGRSKSRSRKVSDTLKRFLRPVSGASFSERRTSGGSSADDSGFDFACGGSPVDLGDPDDFYNLAAKELEAEEETNRRQRAAHKVEAYGATKGPYSAPPVSHRLSTYDPDPFAKNPPLLGRTPSDLSVHLEQPASAIPIIVDVDGYFSMPNSRRVPHAQHPDFHPRTQASSSSNSTMSDDPSVRVSAFPFPAPPRARTLTQTGPSSPDLRSTQQPPPPPIVLAKSHLRTISAHSRAVPPRVQGHERTLSAHPAARAQYGDGTRVRTRSGSGGRGLPRPGPPPQCPLPEVPIGLAY